MNDNMTTISSPVRLNGQLESNIRRSTALVKGFSLTNLFLILEPFGHLIETIQWESWFQTDLGFNGYLSYCLTNCVFPCVILNALHHVKNWSRQSIMQQYAIHC